MSEKINTDREAEFAQLDAAMRTGHAMAFDAAKRQEAIEADQASFEMYVRAAGSEVRKFPGRPVRDSATDEISEPSTATEGAKVLPFRRPQPDHKLTK